MNWGADRNYADMIGHKNMGEYQRAGGAAGLLKAFSVDCCTASPPPASPNGAGSGSGGDMSGRGGPARTLLGIRDTSVRERRQRYGANVIPQPEPESIWHYIVESIKDDRTIQILIGSAFLSIILGMTTPDFRTGEVEPSTGWIEGAAIFVSVFIVTAINAVNDYRKQEQFAQVMRTEEEGRRPVTVWRFQGGSAAPAAHTALEVPSSELVVGDVVQVSAGMQLTFDGVLLESFGAVVVDECSVTGENDDISKSGGGDPFLISGSSVLDGSAEGTALVCAVGVNSFSGKIALAIQNAEKTNTPLQDQLEAMADAIGKFGVAAATLTFVALLLKELYMYLIFGTRMYAMKFFENLTTAIAIVVVAVPEGLPLSVTISLAYSMRRMLKDGNLVRHLAACETMGGATVLCTDKTGTLTEPNMRLCSMYVGGRSYESGATSGGGRSAWLEVSLPPAAVQLLLNCVVSNALDPEVGRAKNKTAEALMSVCDDISCAGQRDFRGTATSILRTLRDTHNSHRYPFSSQQKVSVAAVRIDGATVRYYMSGAPEMVLARCDVLLDHSGAVAPLSPLQASNAQNIIVEYSSRGLRTVCFAYADVRQSGPLPPPPERSFCLLGIAALEERIRSEVPQAVQQCIAAGVQVIMITGDAPLTALNIARRCGLLASPASAGGGAGVGVGWQQQQQQEVVHMYGDVEDPVGGPGSPAGAGDPLTSGAVMDGPTFRGLADEVLVRQYVPHLAVLARATPMDKRRMVDLLRRVNPRAVVAMTGDGTNDAPALKASDVGFAMNAGSDVAKRASDIVLLNDNFAGMVKAIMWGRNVKDNIRKFLQFQLTVNAAACIIAFVGAVLNDQNMSPLKPVQLLWINLIMDTLAALALATELPCEATLLSRPPEPKDTPIITHSMWFQIVCQSSFQLVVQIALLTFGDFRAPHRRGGRAADTDTKICVVFNTFVWMQIFNFFNARLLNRNERFFSHWEDSKVLLVIVTSIALVQILVVECGGRFMSTVPLSLAQWAFCLVCASGALAVGYLARRAYWEHNLMQSLQPPRLVKTVSRWLAPKEKD